MRVIIATIIGGWPSDKGRADPGRGLLFIIRHRGGGAIFHKTARLALTGGISLTSSKGKGPTVLLPVTSSLSSRRLGHSPCGGRP